MISIYIQGEPQSWLAGELLRYSIIKRTDAEIKFYDLEYLEGVPSLPKNFSRFEIPFFQKYDQKAIFLKTGQIVLGDIQELFDQHHDEKPALAVPFSSDKRTLGFDTSVMVLDSSRLRDWIPLEWANKFYANPQLLEETILGLEDSLSYPYLGELSSNWNSVEKITSDTKLINYSKLTTQPWKNNSHPHRDLFVKELNDALVNDQIDFAKIIEEVNLGHIHKGLLIQILEL